MTFFPFRQDRIAQAVVSKLTAEQKNSSAPLARYKIDAYRLYLRERFKGTIVLKVGCCSFALIHLGLGERAQALDYLEKGVAQHDGPLSLLGVHPAYDVLRQEPRFTAILKRICLAS